MKSRHTEQPCLDINLIMGCDLGDAQEEVPEDPYDSKRRMASVKVNEVQHMRSVQINFERMNRMVRENVQHRKKQQAKQDKIDQALRTHGPRSNADSLEVDELDLQNALSQMTNAVTQRSKYRFQDQSKYVNPKARPPSSYATSEEND